ncbi:receptor kinase-like protein Xa21 [Coffea arabica]|uniref:Receptor kinase-like protein Xa21 n=1 Tax=Coffea arabica TaxID=13443 RepID=A0A6P6UZN4_COFAR|nr:receptor kinase-like protein Xa21 [Coffea arabica]
MTESSSSELSFFSALTHCQQLRRLRIGYNPLNGILPSSVGNLSTSLEYVYAAYCGIRGYIPNEFTNLSSLAFLFLQGNNLAGFIPATIGALSKLLNNLGFLSLSYNEFCRTVPACLGNITSLRYIYLSSNKFNSAIPSSFGSLGDLLHLDLSSNYLSGSLPSEIGSLKAATLLNVSMNQILGVIPSAIGGMQDVIDLSLAFNRFEGPIPRSIGNMLALESLDLSSNNLSGSIPNSLEALSHLSLFNVSFNRLSGEIPSGGPFANFTSKSFMSNERLCGTPQLQVPACRASLSGKRRTKRVLLIVLITLAVSLIVVAIIIPVALMRSRKTSSTITGGDSLDAIAHGRISYHEIEQATKGFSERNLIGMGAYGSVYKALINGSNVAVKVFNLQIKGAFRSFDIECEVLRNLGHRNLTKVISSCSSLDFKALIFEYMSNGSLEKWLYYQDLYMDFLQRLDIMIDVASVLDYLHDGYSIPVLHCDLKPNNVLLDENIVAHVGDFGTAKLLGMGESMAQTQTLATLGYMAPKYGSEGLISKKCHIYSFGIMLMETFTRRKPTNEMLSGDMTLKDWINASWPDAVSEVIHANLMRLEEDLTGMVHGGCQTTKNKIYIKTYSQN